MNAPAFKEPTMNLQSLSHGARLSLAASGAAAVLGLGLVGCQGSSGGGDDLTVAGDVPLAYAQRSTAMSLNPTDGTPSAPAALREAATQP